jgi:hypothetical protein
VNNYLNNTTADRESYIKFTKTQSCVTAGFSEEKGGGPSPPAVVAEYCLLLSHIPAL